MLPSPIPVARSYKRTSHPPGTAPPTLRPIRERFIGTEENSQQHTRPPHHPSLRAAMFPLQFMNFCLAVSGCCRHVAKCADGIYRFIRIDAVEELVIVHSPACIVGLHDWIPESRGCTAFGQTEVASPQSALQQQIPSHSALLNTAKTLTGSHEPPCLRCFLPHTKNDNTQKNPALSCAKPSRHAPHCPPYAATSFRSQSASPTQPPHAHPKSTTPFGPTDRQIPTLGTVGRLWDRNHTLNAPERETL